MEVESGSVNLVSRRLFLVVYYYFSLELNGDDCGVMSTVRILMHWHSAFRLRLTSPGDDGDAVPPFVYH